MSNTKFKIKFWNKTPSVIIPAIPLPPILKKSNSTISENNDNNDNSEHAPPQSSKSKGKKDPWKYVGFVKSDDPKYNGSKAIKLNRKVLNLNDKNFDNNNDDNNSSSDNVNSSKSKKKSKESAKRSRSESVSKSREVKKQRVRNIQNNEVEEELDNENNIASKIYSDTPHPLLSRQFILKHALYGHSHDSIYRQEKKKKKKVPTQTSTKRSRKRGRGRRRKNSREEESEDEDELDSDNYISAEEEFREHQNDHDDNESEEDEEKEDDHLDIWSCEFEPSSPASSSSSTLVALCGAHSILFLDAHQGRYLKKYTHPEARECFYSLSWTLLNAKQLEVEDEGFEHSTAILAAAGKLGSIKLLEPLQNHCYCILHGHSQPVLKLSFVKKEPRWLLSSSQDMTIRLWDIGTPSQETEFSCLGIFKVPGSTLASSISLSYGLSLLVAGTAKADLFQYSITKKNIEQWRKHTYRSITNTDDEDDEDKNDDNNNLPITIKPSGKFAHGNEWHEGYIDDIYILGQDGDSKNELYKYVVSRGSDDMEILIWNPVTSKQTDADIILSLNWPDNEENTGLRFCIIEENGQKLLLSGDYEGSIRIFDIGDGKISKTLKDGSKEKFEPFKILENPLSKKVIRDVCVSKDGKTVVAVDSSNSVFIWGVSDEN